MDKLRDNVQGYTGVLMGILAGSFAATLIRLAQGAGMPSLALAAGRLGLAALVLLPFALRTGLVDMQALTRRQWGLVLLAGLLMAAHFATFISALEYTAVLSTLVFAATTPFFAAFIVWFTTGERLRRRVWAGIVLAAVGTLFVAFGADPGDPPTRAMPLLGNSLALGAAFFIAIYFAIGRAVRASLNTATYSALVFGMAALWLLLALPVAGQSMLGHSPEAYLWTVAVAVVAQLIGHSGWNLALGGFPAPVVSLALLMVPVAATGVALVFLGEVPGLWSWVGGAVILAGVAVAVLRRR